MGIAAWREFESRKLDFLWAALSLGLAVSTWIYAVRDPYAPIWLYVLLDLQCAVIFAVRRPAHQSTTRPLEVLVTLLSLNYLFAFDPVPITSARLAAVGGFVSAAGAIMALISIQCLGRSFAILPSLRNVQTTGMYRFVRHPIYLSYIVMAFGVVLRHPTLYNAAVALVGVALMICRIRFEERLLQQDDRYRDYMVAIRYRLFPGVY